MDFVTSKGELIENATTLNSYLKTSDADKQKFVRSLVSRGKSFVVVKIDGKLQFFPSRFMGYKNNTQEKHDEGMANRSVDGRKTNLVIDTLMQCRSLPNDELEKEYVKFCESIGIRKVIGKIRPRFWETVLGD